MHSVVEWGRFSRQVLLGDAPPSFVCRTFFDSTLERRRGSDKSEQYIFHPSAWTPAGTPTCSPLALGQPALEGALVAHVGNTQRVPVGKYRPFVSTSLMPIVNWRYGSYKLRQEQSMGSSSLSFAIIPISGTTQHYTYTDTVPSPRADPSLFNELDLRYLSIFGSLNSEIVFYPHIETGKAPFIVTYDRLVELLPSAERDGTIADFPGALERLQAAYKDEEQSGTSYAPLLALENDLKSVQLSAYQRLLEAMDDDGFFDEGEGLGAQVFGLLPLYEILKDVETIAECRQKLVKMVEASNGDDLHEAWKKGALALQAL